MNFEQYAHDPTLLTICLREEDHTVGNVLVEVVSAM